MPGFLARLFDTNDFTPQLQRGEWTAFHGWLSISSDLAVGFACVTPFCVLAYLLIRWRKSGSFRSVQSLFALFVLACGAAHLLDAIAFWWPAHRLSALVRFFAAVASCTTVITLVPIARRMIRSEPPKEISAAGREDSELAAELAALRERQGWFQTIIEVAPGAAITFRQRPDGLIDVLYASPVVTGVFGWPAGDFERRGGILSTVHPGDRERLLRTLSESGRAGRQWREDFRANHPVRGEIWVRGGACPQAEPDGGTLWHGFFLDVSARKCAKDEARSRNVELKQRVDERTAALVASDAESRRQSSLLRAVLDGMTEGVVATDRNGRFLLFNPAAERILGRGAGDVPPDHWSEHYQIMEADGVTPIATSDIPLVRALGGEPVATRLLTVARPDHRSIVLDCTATPLVSNSRERLGAVAVFRDVTELRAKTAALRATTSRLALALDAAHMGVWEWDAVTGAFFWSPTCAEITGERAVTGLDDFRSLVHPDDATRVRSEIARVLVGSGSFELEYRIVRPDGRDVWVSNQGRAECDDASRPRRLLGTIQDISERKATERALVESEDRFRRITDAAPAIVWALNPQGETTLLSRGWHEFTGQSVEETRGLGTAEVIHPDDRARVVERVQEALRGQRLFQDDYRIRAADGTYRWAFGRARPWFDATGAFLGLVGSVIDISDRKAAEERLLQSETRFRTFVDHATDGFFLHDETGLVLDVNRQTCEALGYSREELIGMYPRDFDPSYSPERVALLMARLDREESVVFDTIHRRKDGTEFPVEVRVRRFTDGVRRLSVALVGNISARKAAEEQLRAALEEKQVLLREVHHRVKNNLQVVCSLFDMQLHQAPTSDAAGILREAQNRVHSMALIHEQLYQQHTLSSIDFADYLRVLVSQLVGAYHSVGADLILELDLEPLELPVDAAIPCGLIINELTSNILKHAFIKRTTGSIRITIDRHHDLVNLTVSDDGSGIADGVDPYNPKTLGLRLVTALTDQINGSVCFENRDGTTVRLAFPLPQPKRTRGPHSVAPAPRSGT